MRRQPGRLGHRKLPALHVDIPLDRSGLNGTDLGQPTALGWTGCVRRVGPVVDAGPCGGRSVDDLGRDRAPPFSAVPGACMGECSSRAARRVSRLSPARRSAMPGSSTDPRHVLPVQGQAMKAVGAGSARRRGGTRWHSWRSRPGRAGHGRAGLRSVIRPDVRGLSRPRIGSRTAFRRRRLSRPGTLQRATALPPVRRARGGRSP